MLGSASPVRFSSAPRGEPIKSGVLAIAEDIVAVDAKKGTELRVLMHQRYDASPPIQKVCRNLDLLWGISGIGVTAGIVAVIFAVNNNSVGFAVGTSHFRG